MLFLGLRVNPSFICTGQRKFDQRVRGIMFLLFYVNIKVHGAQLSSQPCSGTAHNIQMLWPKWSCFFESHLCLIWRCICRRQHKLSDLLNMLFLCWWKIESVHQIKSLSTTNSTFKGKCTLCSTCMKCWQKYLHFQGIEYIFSLQMDCTIYKKTVIKPKKKPLYSLFTALHLSPTTIWKHMICYPYLALKVHNRKHLHDWFTYNSKISSNSKNKDKEDGAKCIQVLPF